MEEIIKKYSQKLEDVSYRPIGIRDVVDLEEAKLILREALEEYKCVYKTNRRFDFWGNEIY